ncbi:hypothetical protein M426DRAFT_16801 [Hypoxylon sp. CI-4A]|nr:hypothetical protein M426DRAFT_16801 [Hypoxylon sp. CI-4A]
MNSQLPVNTMSWNTARAGLTMPPPTTPQDTEVQRLRMRVMELENGLMPEVQQLREDLAVAVKELKGVRLHNAQLQGEVSKLNKPRRGLGVKKALETATERVEELEEEMEGVKAANGQLQGMVMELRRTCEDWQGLYDITKNKVEGLEAEKALNLCFTPDQLGQVVSPPDSQSSKTEQTFSLPQKQEQTLAPVQQGQQYGAANRDPFSCFSLAGNNYQQNFDLFGPQGTLNAAFAPQQEPPQQSPQQFDLGDFSGFF